MKKLVIALIALACAFAISSCCDQSYCPNKMQCEDKKKQQDEPPYRFDQQEQVPPGGERQHRRW